MKYYSGWWFQTFFFFTPTWGRFPNWLIFFRWVETNNQYSIWPHNMTNTHYSYLPKNPNGTPYFGKIRPIKLKGVNSPSPRGRSLGSRFVYGQYTSCCSSLFVLQTINPNGFKNGWLHRFVPPNFWSWVWWLTGDERNNAQWFLRIFIISLFFLKEFPEPKQSIYGIVTYIWLIFMVNALIFMLNVGEYTVHGLYGECFLQISGISLFLNLEQGLSTVSTPAPAPPVLCGSQVEHEDPRKTNEGHPTNEQCKKTWLFSVYRGWDTTQLYYPGGTILYNKCLWLLDLWLFF